MASLQECHGRVKLADFFQKQKSNTKYLINEVLKGRDDEQRVRRINIERLARPSDSPRQSPCGFWFVGRGKTTWRDRRFADLDVIVEALTNLFGNVTFEELPSVFQNCIQRLEWVIRHSGGCFIK
jgi:hypothetical protein